MERDIAQRLLFRRTLTKRCRKIGNSHDKPRYDDEDVEDKVTVGGLGLAVTRKTKSKISV